MRWAAALVLLGSLAADVTRGRPGGLVRVLYVDHVPRWEFRYLKNSLRSDPRILFHAFLTSADKDFPQEHSLPAGFSPKFVEAHREFFTPLKKLPESLRAYDVVILGDVHPDMLGEAFVGNLEKFVRKEGGGLIMIAGTRHNPESFVGTRLQALLPVVPPDKPKAAGEVDKPLGYAVAGGRHPITRFSSDADEDRKLWEDVEKGIPAVFWFKAVRSIKPEATAIVEVRDPRAPLFVCAPAGSGRVFMSLTDETWHWRFQHGDAPYFYPFWRRVLAWASDHRR